MSSTGSSIVEDHIVNTAKKILYAEYSSRGQLANKTVEIDLCNTPAKYGLDQESFLLSLILLDRSGTITLETITNPSLECLKAIGRAVARLDLLHLNGKLSGSVYEEFVRSLYRIAGVKVEGAGFPQSPSSPIDEERIKIVLRELVAEPCRKLKAVVSIVEELGAPSKTLMAALAEELRRYTSKARSLWGGKVPAATGRGEVSELMSLIEAFEEALQGDLAGVLTSLVERCERLGVAE